MKKIHYIAIILALSVLVHLLFIGHPDEVVFDEVHFGRYAANYFEHTYFFDNHPPFGKLLFALAGKLASFEPGFDFTSIGNQFKEDGVPYVAMRLPSLLAGIFLPLIIFFFCLRLGLSRFAAFLASLFIILDNALLTQSRLMLLDVLILFLGFSSLLLYSRYYQEKKLYNLLLAAAMAAAAFGVKWTGGVFFGLIGLAEYIRIIKIQSLKSLLLPIIQFFTFLLWYIFLYKPDYTGFWDSSAWLIVLLILNGVFVIYRAKVVDRSKLFRNLIYYVVVAFLAYFIIIMIHFRLIPNSGDGNGFMTPGFKATLIGTDESRDDSIVPLDSWGKFKELNSLFYSNHAHLDATHPYSSKIYEWPLMMSFSGESRVPIYYWFRDNEGSYSERIFLIGNPLIWWLAATGMLYLIINLAFSIPSMISRRYISRENKIQIAIFVGYFFSVVPYFGITRILFLYHYFPAFIFSIIALALFVDGIHYKKQIGLGLLALSVVVFVYFAPLSYGLSLDWDPKCTTKNFIKNYECRVWFERWK